MLNNAVKQVSDQLMLSDLLQTPIADQTDDSKRKRAQNEKENSENFSIAPKKGLSHLCEIGIVSLSQAARKDDNYLKKIVFQPQKLFLNCETIQVPHSKIKSNLSTERLKKRKATGPPASTQSQSKQKQQSPATTLQVSSHKGTKK